jgi:hypothetical protein
VPADPHLHLQNTHARDQPAAQWPSSPAVQPRRPCAPAFPPCCV